MKKRCPVCNNLISIEGREDVSPLTCEQCGSALEVRMFFGPTLSTSVVSVLLLMVWLNINPHFDSYTLHTFALISAIGLGIALSGFLTKISTVVRKVDIGS